jgi:hypothetical protein
MVPRQFTLALILSSPTLFLISSITDIIKVELDRVRRGLVSVRLGGFMIIYRMIN